MAGIVADAWLSDQRHAHAPHASMSDASRHVAGQRCASTNNHDLHLDDAMLSEAVERSRRRFSGDGPPTALESARSNRKRL